MFVHDVTCRTRIFLLCSSPIVSGGLRLGLEQAGPVEVVGWADAEVASVAPALRSQAEVIVVAATDGPPGPVVRAVGDGPGEPVPCVVLGEPDPDGPDARAVPWQATIAELCAAIVAVRGGRAVGTDGAFAEPGLSCRELEVLRCAAAGRTNFSTARALGLSEATVKTYWQRIFKKLAARDRTKAVATAIGLGLLADPGPQTARAEPDDVVRSAGMSWLAAVTPRRVAS